MARNALIKVSSFVRRTASIFRCKCLSQHFALTLLISILVHIPSDVQAAQTTQQICERAAQYAAQKTGVPVSVLQAISLTETGRTNNGVTRTWPWTVNMEGKGVWFDNEDQARAYVYKNYKRGARSFDVGCFQINYKWHGHEFASIEEMFDPISNALYAAKFLQKLYNEKQDWDNAAGAYHSRTAKYAKKYKTRFNAFRASILAKAESPVKPAHITSYLPLRTNTVSQRRVVRDNLYPLLQRGEKPKGFGSLVPFLSNRNKRGLIPLGDNNG